MSKIASVGFFFLFWILNDNRIECSADLERRRDNIVASPRIVGGREASVGEYPFFASWDKQCGASLIHEDILLTAAHCSTITSNSVIVGAYTLGDTTGGAVLREIVHRRMHPDYDEVHISSDYMILKLDATVEGIRPVELNRHPATPSESDDLFVMGFGTTSEESRFQQGTLQDVTIQKTRRSSCESMYGTLYNDDIMLCAAAEDKDACFGDSGGPLLKKNTDGRYIQVGITSWAIGCARPDFHGIYARVSAVLAWINQSVCDLAKNPPKSCAATATDETNPTAPPTRAPSSSPILVTYGPTTTTPSQYPIVITPPCEDSYDAVFRVDARLGKRGCQWLTRNLDQYQYLCDFSEVSIKCPGTCQTCFSS